jgi:hypothetical protein
MRRVAGFSRAPVFGRTRAAELFGPRSHNAAARLARLGEPGRDQGGAGRDPQKRPSRLTLWRPRLDGKHGKGARTGIDPLGHADGRRRARRRRMLPNKRARPLSFPASLPPVDSFALVAHSIAFFPSLTASSPHVANTVRRLPISWHLSSLRSLFEDCRLHLKMQFSVNVSCCGK